MKEFFKRLFNALKPCAGIVHAPRFKSALPSHGARTRGSTSASGRLVSLVVERDIEQRKAKIIHYDFTSFK